MNKKEDNDKKNRSRDRERNLQRKSRKSDNEIKGNRKGIILILISFLAVATMFIIKNKLGGNKIIIDEKTLCPIHTAIPNHKVIVIDKSEKWDDDDIVRLQRLLELIYKNIQFQERLTVTAITSRTGQSTEIESLFDMCNPGGGSEDECNSLYQNCKHLKKRYDASFGEPLHRLSKILSEPGKSSYSPLFETISQVIDDNKSGYLEINFISDLMENSQHFRFDEVIPLADELIKEFPVKANATILVHVNFIARTRHDQVIKSAALSVWHDYFQKQGIVFDSQQLLITKH